MNSAGLRLLGGSLLAAVPSAVLAASPELPALFGIPIEFILFGLTLVGVALFHRYTLYVALAGLTAISLYKIFFTASTKVLVLPAGWRTSDTSGSSLPISSVC